MVQGANTGLAIGALKVSWQSEWSTGFPRGPTARGVVAGMGQNKATVGVPTWPPPSAWFRWSPKESSPPLVNRCQLAQSAFADQQNRFLFVTEAPDMGHDLGNQRGLIRAPGDHNLSTPVGKLGDGLAITLGFPIEGRALVAGMYRQVPPTVRNALFFQ